ALGQPEQPGHRRRRPRGLPQRAASRRRRHHHRAARHRRCDDPAGRPVLHPRRCGQRRHRRHGEHQPTDHEGVPQPRASRRWLPDAARHHATRHPGLV
ncbi:MAG: FIG00817807: hypothetical protein, partial [uncultured Nocardioides sp.]